MSRYQEIADQDARSGADEEERESRMGPGRRPCKCGVPAPATVARQAEERDCEECRYGTNCVAHSADLAPTPPATTCETPMPPRDGKWYHWDGHAWVLSAENNRDARLPPVGGRTR